jgi:O-antigen/teichoic acid export membrane protein
VSSAAARPLARRVARNTAVQAIGKALVLAIGAASIAIATRYLGVADYGKFALALAFVQTLGVLADLGLLTIAVREISRAPERTEEVVGTTLALRLLLSLSVVALSLPLAFAAGYPHDVRVAVLIVGASLVLGMANSSIVAVFQARLAMGRAVIGDVAGRAAGLAALGAAVALDLGFYAVVSTVVVGALTTLCVTFTLSRGVVRVRPRAGRRAWAALLAASIPVGLALAVNEIYFRADTFIISLSRDYDEVGAYSLAYRVIELLAIFPAIVMTSVFPLLSRYVEENRQLARRTLDATAAVFAAIGAPLAAGGLVAAPQVVRLVAGDGFDEAVVPLQWLLFAGALAAVSGLIGYALIAAGRQGDALRLSAAVLAVNLGLNLALVPSQGIDAAAAVAVGSEILLVLGGLMLVHRHLDWLPDPGPLWRSAVAAAGMAAALWPLRERSLALLLPLGAAVYAVLLWLLGGVDRRALEALRT